jgi:protease-4
MRTIRRTAILTLAVLATACGARQAHADATLGWIELEGTLAERQDPFAWLFGASKPTLRDVVTTIESVAERDDLDGLVIRLREPALATSQIEELGQAMTHARDAGKKIHVFTEIYGPGELMLGAFADEAIMQSGGAVSFPGIHMEEMFLADTLGWLGIKMDFVQIGDYKGASEQLGRNAPSEAWNENISQLLDGLYGAMREHILKGRHLSARELDDAMKTLWYASGEVAIEEGLIDTVIDRLDLPEHLESIYGGDVTYETNLLPEGSGSGLDAMANPFAMLQTLSQKPDHRPKRNTIAIVDINGAIVDGESTPASPLGGGSSVGSLTIRTALKQIEDEPLIKGVIVRIDSPGGSAIASESIWLGLQRIAEHKPVWVSVGSMAASGGYYIAVAGEKIYVNPSSIVGSIGVVGGKPVLGGAYDKLRINVVPRDRGPAASLMSTIEPWTDKQRDLVRERMTETYDLFVERVESGRSGINIDTTAEGRLFTGQKAIDLNMADHIGGLDVAIDDLAEHLHLAEGRYDVMRYPGPKSFDKMLEEMLGGFMLKAPEAKSQTPSVLAAAVATLREMVGERAWASVSTSLNAMWQLRREPVILVSPRVLMFR